MKKLLLLSIILIVGCEKNPTEPEVHPLVGIWEQTEITITFTSGTLNGTTMTVPVGENTEMGASTWIFGEDGVASMTSTDAATGTTDTDAGTWSATGNKLTIIPTDDGEETVIFDFTISGNILTISYEYDGTADGEDSFSTEIKFGKQ